jgi:putative ABC transport system permease protein
MVKILAYPKYALKAIWHKKLRFILGVLAIATAIGVFGVTSVLTDSISNSFLPEIAKATGQVDIEITKYNITSTPPITNYETLITKIDNVSGVVGATPRYKLQGAGFQGDNKTYTVTFLGLDPQREKEIDFGDIILEPEVDLGNLPVNQCWIDKKIGQALGLEIGENYQVTIGFSNVNLTVDSFYTNIDMLPSDKDNFVLTNIKTLEPFIGGEGIATEIVAQFENREELYDVKQPEKTVEEAKKIGIDVQNAIGTTYQVSLPIANALESQGEGMSFIRVFMVALSILGVLVSGFLIFSLMTVSVEDKTREFALYRTIGAKRRQIFILVIVEALIICIVGALIGIGFSYLFNALVNVFLRNQEIDVSVVMSPLTVLYSLLLGIGVAILASLVPALQAMRKSIISGLNPLKAEEPELKLDRERGVNKKMFTIGLAIAISSGVIFILIPILTVSASDVLFFSLILGLFFAFAFGCSLILVGVFEPLFENLLLWIIKPAFNKTIKIIRMFLKRNRQRNSITSMMFVLAFGATMIISTTFLVQNQGTIVNLSSQTGSDIVIIDGSYDVNGTQLLEEITNDYDDITSSSYRTAAASTIVTGMWSVAGDELFFKSRNVHAIGITENITQPLFAEHISITEGDEDIFKDVQENQTVIISEALAKDLKLEKGDQLRFKFLTINPVLMQMGYPQDLFFEIVGVVGKLPGFSNIHRQERFASGSSILLGEETWTFLTKQNFQDAAQLLYFDTESTEDAIEIGREIRRKYQNDAIGVIINEEIVDQLEQSMKTQIILVNVMLIFTIVIALFGVFASTYSNVAESHKTIGILKAIGLKNHHVDLIFIMESVILTLASSFLGGAMGYGLGYYLFSINAIEMEWKIPIVQPPTITLVSLAIALAIASLGAYIASRMISKKSASDLLRVG